MTLNFGAGSVTRSDAQVQHDDLCESCGEPLDIEGVCVTQIEGDCE